MSGNLIVDKVAKTTGDTKTDLVRGLAKAWSVFNGTGTIALANSLNVSSLLDQGVGDYANNLASAMSSANFAISQVGNNYHTLTAASSASTARVNKAGSSHAAEDASIAGMAAHGDLA